MFGFEADIIFTKPPFINKIVKHSPADRSHLETGDFIIFIDKKNIVDMKKEDILDLINNTDTITLEVFRRANPKLQIQHTATSSIMSSESIITTREIQKPIIEKTISEVKQCEVKQNEVKQNEVKQSEVKQSKVKQSEAIETTPKPEIRKNKLVSRSSTDSKKKHLTFSKDEVIKSSLMRLVKIINEHEIPLQSTTSGSIDSQRSFKLLNNILQSERQFIEAINFGCNRYVVPRKYIQR